MEDKIWHITNDFIRLKPWDVLNNLLRDDKANYDRAEVELSDEIQLADEAISLYIELLQEAYRRLDEWETNDSNRAAIAMAVSALNYILLARHSLLLGYYPEARDLLRGCYKRTTRSYLFFVDDKEALRTYGLSARVSISQRR